jgi:hypothetical protein
MFPSYISRRDSEALFGVIAPAWCSSCRKAAKKAIKQKIAGNKQKGQKAKTKPSIVLHKVFDMGFFPKRFFVMFLNCPC